ncbi:MAG: flagellar basal body P-ring protein FlgI [Cyanobacteria bacterium SIG27]|nr:flagellar basal body P-ring protein FlgI [Cyanobacteria bacterium SIG27]
MVSRMITMSKKLIAFILTSFMGLSLFSEALAISEQTLRIKDITHVKGIRENQVVGYGLVVGLQNTGDNSRHTQMTSQQMLQSLGTVIDQSNYIQKGTSAAVIVTATIPPFAKEGDKIDVTVSAMADAKSLTGGVLVQTQLRAPNGEIVAVAQGPVSTGGVRAAAGGASASKGVTTTGRVPNGAIVERDILSTIGDETTLTLLLDKADYTMASRISKTISTRIAPARALDGGAVEITIPSKYRDDRVTFLSLIENQIVGAVSEKAKVIVNERTGTIVIGGNTKLMPAAIAHGGITINIQVQNEVIQPNPMAQGDTALQQNAQIQITEKQASLIELEANSNLSDLVSALNVIGVSPTDLIAILQALATAGSLQAELEII